MLRTITLGSCVSVQGLVVGQMADGRLEVRVDEKTFVGMPVPAAGTVMAARATSG
jgi:phosphatidylserine synthase